MAKNTINDLRDHLFAQLERLNDETIKPENMAIEIEKSKAMADITRSVIESAKVEVQFLKEIGALKSHSEFFKVPQTHQLT